MVVVVGWGGDRKCLLINPFQRKTDRISAEIRNACCTRKSSCVANRPMYWKGVPDRWGSALKKGIHWTDRFCSDSWDNLRVYLCQLCYRGKATLTSDEPPPPVPPTPSPLKATNCMTPTADFTKLACYDQSILRILHLLEREKEKKKKEKRKKKKRRRKKF